MDFRVLDLIKNELLQLLFNLKNVKLVNAINVDKWTKRLKENEFFLAALQEKLIF